MLVFQPITATALNSKLQSDWLTEKEKIGIYVVQSIVRWCKGNKQSALGLRYNQILPKKLIFSKLSFKAHVLGLRSIQILP